MDHAHDINDNHNNNDNNNDNDRRSLKKSVEAHNYVDLDFNMDVLKRFKRVDAKRVRGLIVDNMST